MEFFCLFVWLFVCLFVVVVFVCCFFFSLGGVGGDIFWTP